jgi:DNA-binding NtrC family response regulator
MNGWDALTAFRRINPRIPVILSSGYDESHAMAGEHAELPQAFLSKPYDLKSLKDVIDNVLSR